MDRFKKKDAVFIEKDHIAPFTGADLFIIGSQGGCEHKPEQFLRIFILKNAEIFMNNAPGALFVGFFQ